MSPPTSAQLASKEGRMALAINLYKSGSFTSIREAAITHHHTRVSPETSIKLGKPQSEDIQAVPAQDVGRTCILQGPVSVQYSKKINEPVKEILDEINNGFIAKLKSCSNSCRWPHIPALECFGLKPIVLVDTTTAENFITTQKYHDRITHEVLPGAVLSLADQNVWRSIISGCGDDWRHALFERKTIRRDLKQIPNPAIQLFAAQPGCSVCIRNIGSDGPTVTYFESGAGGDIIQTVEARAKDNIVTIEIFEHRTCSGAPESLTLFFQFAPSSGFSPLVEMNESHNRRVRQFYHRLWFGMPFKDQYSIHDKFHAEEFTITSSDIANFTRSVDNSNNAFVKQVGKTFYAPLDFAVVIAWKALMKPLFCSEINGDLLTLVHLSNSITMRPEARLFQVDDVLTTKTFINSIISQKTGKMFEVVGQIFTDGKPIIDLKSQFLYRGRYTDFKSNFQRIIHEPVNITLAAHKDVALLLSKPWFRLLDPNTNLDGCTLLFRPEILLEFKDRDIFSKITVRGSVESVSRDQPIRVGTIQYDAGISHGNPVVEYLKRHGQPSASRNLLGKAVPFFSDNSLIFQAPSSNESYGKISGEFNPIHVSRAFMACAGLPGTIVHGMWTSAKVRGIVERLLCGSVAGLFRSWKCTFMDMVLPEDALEVKFKHIGMASGRKIITVTANSRESGSVVLQGECEVEPPKTVYLFTGQGSQQQGMRMDLYNESPVARSVWDHADTYHWDTYGFRITDIVRRDPKSLKISFGGVRGRRIRDNYMALKCDAVQPNGTMKSESIFSSTSDQTTSYIFRASGGLLSATQFTQPALTLMGKATFEDMKSRGLISADSRYAGHSLGEYSALASMADICTIEKLVSVVFYRGLTMQLAVERDEAGNSDFSMCAVDPSRVTTNFDEPALRMVCQEIVKQSNLLLEIVNYNIANKQYVCAGDLRALKILTEVLNRLHQEAVGDAPFPSINGVIKSHITAMNHTTQLRDPSSLKRGIATIPLNGIDVPFHSSFAQETW